MKKQSIDAEKLLNKRVQHMKSVYGSGFVAKVTDSSITIELDNGREANFSTDIFEKGIVKFIV